MESNAYKTAELVQRVSELEKEQAKLKQFATEGERALVEVEKLRAKLRTAEQARTEAERAAEHERLARIHAESSRDELFAGLQAANAQPSRLECLIAERPAVSDLEFAAERAASELYEKAAQMFGDAYQEAERAIGASVEAELYAASDSRPTLETGLALV